VNFLVDMPLSPSLARWLERQGHDAVHASAVGLDRAGDAEIMARAVQESRTIITADLDYPRLLALAQATGPSLILLRGGDWSDAHAITRISEVLAGRNEVDFAHSIFVVERARVRRRRLPIV
jgi:predicted nuclease of predicted toxin-antitoxin system